MNNMNGRPSFLGLSMSPNDVICGLTLPEFNSRFIENESLSTPQSIISRSQISTQSRFNAEPS